MKGNYQVTLRLPSSPEDFREDTDDEPVLAWVPTAGNGGPAGAAIVRLIQTEVGFGGNISAAEWTAAKRARDDGDRLSALADRVQSLAEGAHESATQCVHNWLAHLRTVAAQPWLGVRAEPPVQFGRMSIVDVDADVTLMQFGPLQIATVHLGDLALTLGQLDAVHRSVDVSDEPPVAESLLADARFLASEADVIDSQRAVLLVAMACEIKTKAAIASKVDVLKADAIGLLLRRASNLSTLLDEVINAALGRSLRTEDQDLYRAVKRLTEVRNQVVHRGVQVDENEARRLTAVGGQLFVWLDGV